MPIVYAAQAPHFELPGYHFTGLTSPSRGATELCTWRLEIDPNSASDPHYLNHEEVFIILEGTVTVTVNQEVNELSAGDAISIPAQSQLQVDNRTAAPARLVVCVPVGIQGVMADGQVVGTPLWAQ